MLAAKYLFYWDYLSQLNLLKYVFLRVYLECSL